MRTTTRQTVGRVPRPPAVRLLTILFIAALGLALAACATTADAPADEPVVFYPLPPDAPRIQFLRSISLDTDIEEPPSGLDALLFGEVTVHRGVMAPYGAAIWKDIIYVCDIQQGVVLTFDLRGRKMDYLQLEGRGRLQKPVNLEFATDGTLYVADLGRRQIVVLDGQQRYTREFGPYGEDSKPTDVAVSGDKLFVADPAARLIRVVDRQTGEQLSTIGSGDDDSPHPRAPTNLALGEDGKLYVVDSVDCVVYVWEQDGTFVGTVGGPGDVVGQFGRPKGIAIHSDLMFVVDASFENCQIFDMEGEPLMFFGGTGVGPGNLYLPAGVWVGDEGTELFADLIDDDFEAKSLVIITSQFGPRKVNFYAFGGPKGPAAPADGEAPPGS